MNALSQTVLMSSFFVYKEFFSEANFFVYLVVMA